MVKHLAVIGGLVVLIVLATFYPFLPGKYDSLAVPLSTTVQLSSAAALLLVPIGIIWLVYELRQRARGKRNLPTGDRSYTFALVSLIAGSILAVLVSLLIFTAIGILAGALALALWSLILARLIPRLKLLRGAEAQWLNPTPVYLIAIPVAVLLAQAALAAPATEFSRDWAIANSTELINEIESHYAEQGHYPSSLLAVSKDYYPSIIGIEGFNYARHGNAYSLFFEQPTLLFDNPGTREFVMYNKLDEHVMPSHAAWILFWSPEQLEQNQGWYEVHDASTPHWKYFWFD